jgi:multisubunit Na+/H+ antiporter MnhB subunit
VHHWLRYVVPPLIVVLAVVLALRARPHKIHRKPVHHVRAAAVIAVALIVAFVAAFILP